MTSFILDPSSPPAETHVLFALCGSYPSLPRPITLGQSCFETWSAKYSEPMRRAARFTYERLWPTTKGQLHYHELIDNTATTKNLQNTVSQLLQASKGANCRVIVHLVAYGAGQRVALWDTSGSAAENGITAAHLIELLSLSAKDTPRIVLVNDTGAAMAAAPNGPLTVVMRAQIPSAPPMDNGTYYLPSSPACFVPPFSVSWLSALLLLAESDAQQVTLKSATLWLNYWGLSLDFKGPDEPLAAMAAKTAISWSIFESLWQPSDARIAYRAQLDGAISTSAEAPEPYVDLLSVLEESFDLARGTNVFIPPHEEARAALLRAFLRKMPGAGRALCAAAHRLFSKKARMIPSALSSEGAYNLVQLAFDLDPTPEAQALLCFGTEVGDAKMLLVHSLNAGNLSMAGLAMLVRLFIQTLSPVDARDQCNRALESFYKRQKNVVAQEAHGLVGRLLVQSFPEESAIAATHFSKAGPAFKAALDELTADRWVGPLQEIRTPRTHRAAGELHDTEMKHLTVYISALDHKAQEVGPPLRPLPDSLLWQVAHNLRWAHDKPFLVAGGHGVGGGPAQLGEELCIDVTSNGDVYLSDAHNHRVQRWKPNSPCWHHRVRTVAGGNGAGSGLRQLLVPRGIAADEASHSVLVADSGNHRVMLWEEGKDCGSVVAGGNGPGEDPNQLEEPVIVSVEASSSALLIGCESGRLVRWVRDSQVGVTLAQFEQPALLCGVNEYGEILATSECERKGYLPLWPAHKDRRTTQHTLHLAAEQPDDWPYISVDPVTGTIAALVWPVVLCWARGEWDEPPHVVYECTDDYHPSFVVRRGVVYLCFQDGRVVAYHAATAPRS